MSFDPKVPEKLKRNQTWFGSIIARPIDENSKMNSVSPSGRQMESEAAEYILPSPTLRPDQRIQIYNQQYWWRLLDTLHEVYPFLTRLFGYFDFNQTIGFPYLVKYNPNHWSLNHLGDRLPQWVKEEYTANDKNLVLDAASIDWAYNDSFFAAASQPIESSDDIESLLSKPFALQQHVHLFHLEADLFAVRKEFLEHDADYWLEHDFPEIPQTEDPFYVLYRDGHNNVVHQKIYKGEFALLSRFRKAASIDSACDWLEKEGSAFYEEASHNIHLWIKSWIALGWIG